MLKRLLGIIYILMKKGTATARELAERYEVSVRTIYRDVETLSMAGIPVYTTKGKYGGIHLTEQFVLDKMLVTREEQQQILAALNSLEEVGAYREGDVLQKLEDFFQISSDGWVSIDFSDWSGRRGELFGLLKEAVLRRRVICFDYYGQSGEMNSRTVEPVQLVFKDYTWYLRAYCRIREGVRLFKVLRMKRVRMTDEIFTPREEAGRKDIQGAQLTEPKVMYGVGLTEQNAESCAQWEQQPDTGNVEGSGGYTEIILSIAASEAYRVYDRFEEEEIQVQEDGSFLVTIHYSMDDWVYGMILSFGPSARVIGPESVRKEVASQLRRMLEQYP